MEVTGAALRSWGVIERGMREVLRASSAPSEMSDEVCARMRRVYEQLQFSYRAELKLPLPASATLGESKALADAVSAVFDGLEGKLHEFSTKVMLERLKTEVELFVARKRAGNRTR